MSNPLFNQYGQTPPVIPGNNFMQRLQQFSNMVRGNPQQIVQNLMQSGQMTQDQFNQFSQMADQIVGRR